AQLSFTRELVRHPSLRTREGSAQDLLYAAMAERGLEMDRWELDPADLSTHEGFGPVAVSYENVTNVGGTSRPAAGRGRSLILNGHDDVVPEGPAEAWSRSPWDAPVIDGWMYGRGAGDMKAGLAANLFAF
ncbi:M20/M25/M40 family metallo-hydrolase, partial [Arthrobacter deserti]|nr:M20/M25/M40 family metallo-hydrolase [Arthrobacter deserti]